MMGPGQAPASLQRYIGVSRPPAVSYRLKTRAGVRHARSNVGAVLVWLLYVLAGCSAATPIEPHGEAVSRTEVLYVISGGWHTEIGLPVAALGGSVAALSPEFAGARFLVFGWGARDYYMARNPGIGEVLRAIVPGPAVMLVIPLHIAPEGFFGASNVVAVRVAPDGIERLSRLLWDYLTPDKEGSSPRQIGAGPYPRSVFYAAAGTYHLSHTCNTWTAEALRVAGVSVSSTGVVFAAQLLDQLEPVSQNAQSTN
jgi:uncharacterized protein (TIGR02117 family)